MATIRKLPSGKFQAVVRLKNLKPLYATFPTKNKAKLWAQAVESDTSLARKLATGDDLSLAQAVQVETSKGSVRIIVPLFKEWGESFFDSCSMKDSSAKGRIRYWIKRLGNKLVTDITPEDVDQALLELSMERSGSTINRYKSNLSSVFIAFNHHPNFKRPKFPNPVSQRVCFQLQGKPTQKSLPQP